MIIRFKTVLETIKGLTILLIIGFKILVVIKGYAVVEVLIALTPIIDSERYWAPLKSYCEAVMVVVVVVAVIPSLPEKP